MINKIKENKKKVAVIICIAVLGLAQMITGVEVPEWVRNFLLAVGM